MARYLRCTFLIPFSANPYGGRRFLVVRYHRGYRIYTIRMLPEDPSDVRPRPDEQITAADLESAILDGTIRLDAQPLSLMRS